MKAKKTAKIGHTKQKAIPNDDLSATKLVMISKGHKITDMITGKTVCGARIEGWFYGAEDSITCNEGCK